MVQAIQGEPILKAPDHLVYGGGCTPECDKEFSITVTRDGTLIASGPPAETTSSMLEIETEMENGDVIHMFIDGSEVAAEPVSFPIVTPLACGSNEITGTFNLEVPITNPDPTRVNVGVAGDEEGMLTELGSAYSVVFPFPLEQDNGISIKAHWEDNSQSIAGYESSHLYMSFNTQSVCTSPTEKEPETPTIPAKEMEQSPNGPTAPPATASPPAAQCDMYWTSPRHPLTVPAAEGILNNDADPSGEGLTPHVISINFGLSTHSYSINPRSGALSFNPGKQTAHPFKAVIAYRDTDAAGLASNVTNVIIWVQPKRPAASVFGACPTDGDMTLSKDSFSDLGLTNGDYRVRHVVHLTGVSVSVVLGRNAVKKLAGTIRDNPGNVAFGTSLVAGLGVAACAEFTPVVQAICGSFGAGVSASLIDRITSAGSGGECLRFTLKATVKSTVHYVPLPEALPVIVPSIHTFSDKDNETGLKCHNHY